MSRDTTPSPDPHPHSLPSDVPERAKASTKGLEDLAGILRRNPHHACYVASRPRETWHETSFDRLEPKHHDDRDGRRRALCGRGLRVADGENDVRLRTDEIGR